MTRLWRNVAFRLALGYGALAVGSMSVISAVFYVGTVGVLARSIDAKLLSVSKRLADHFESRGGDGLRQEIQQLLVDGIEQDTEVYLLIGQDGRKIAGNIADWTKVRAPLDSFSDRAVMRDGRPSLSRLLPRLLSDGSILVVGRDMQDQREIEQLVWHALAGGGAVALLLVIGGALRVSPAARASLQCDSPDRSRNRGRGSQSADPDLGRGGRVRAAQP